MTNTGHQKRTSPNQAPPLFAATWLTLFNLLRERMLRTADTSSLNSGKSTDQERERPARVLR
jgi:hypothetical protein